MPGQAPLSGATILLGISFSMVPAVLWPAVARYAAPEQLGTAFGLLTAVQQAGVFVANIAAGYVNDQYAASATNPGGYTAMLWLFGGLSALAFVCAAILWIRGARQRA
jgi:MFS family permease